jgi:hypothetical protein
LGADRLGYRDESDVTVPAEPGTAFEVIEAEAIFEFAVVVFDPHRIFASRIVEITRHEAL